MSTHTFEIKAVSSSSVVQTENGDLLVEGWAARWQGLDRQQENFAPGCFKDAIDRFLRHQSPLCWHHRHEKLLGRVLELEEVPGEGLRFVARVDGAIRSHPELGVIYEQIKRGSVNGVSVGGFFQRQGNKIIRADVTELSLTPAPQHSGTSFSVVTDELVAANQALDALDRTITAYQLMQLQRRVRQLQAS